jgi:hypothetical protein
MHVEQAISPRTREREESSQAHCVAAFVLTGALTEEITEHDGNRDCCDTHLICLSGLAVALVVLSLELAFCLQPLVQVVVQIATVTATFDVNLKRPPMDFVQGWDVLTYFFPERPTRHLSAACSEHSWPDFARSCSFLHCVSTILEPWGIFNLVPWECNNVPCVRQ